MTGKPTILLVDDKKENLFALERLLEDLEVDILQTTSGFQALKIALEQEITTILLDVQMPEIDGYEVAKLLKENNRTRNIPVIFVTAINQEQEHVLKGYETGAVDYLFKPLNPAITIAKVQSFIKIHEQRLTLEKQNIDLENLNMLIQNAVDLMVIFTDKDLKIHNVNPSWKSSLGYSPADLINNEFSSFLSLKKEEFTSLLNDAKQTKGKLLNYEQKMKAVSGKEFWYSWYLVFRNGNWYGNGRNITDKKIADQALSKAYEELEEKVKQRTLELEEAVSQLKRTNADLDSFVYTASHDLKLPVANLEGLHQTLVDELTDQNDDIKTIANMVGHSISQLKDTIHDLIAIVQRSKEPKTDDLITDEDCESILQEIKTSIHDLISSSNAQVNTRFKNCRIKFPKVSFKSILYNLLTNAIKYKSPARRPEISVQIHENGHYHILTVADNGLGISKENLNRLFEKFQRLHQNQNVEGTGIGLFIVKNTVEKFGGKIEVESVEGVGSAFKVYFAK